MPRCSLARILRANPFLVHLTAFPLLSSSCPSRSCTRGSHRLGELYTFRGTGQDLVMCEGPSLLLTLPTTGDLAFAAQPGSLPPTPQERLWAFCLCHVNSRIWREAESQESWATEILPGLSTGGRTILWGGTFAMGEGAL